MEYNTQREPIRLPEYGRTIQEMVRMAMQIEDREERTRAAYSLIQMMSITNPILKEQKDVDDILHKLWDHLFIISDFQLDVDAPYPMPDKDAIHRKPDPLPYPQNRVRYKHYGRYIENLVDRACQMEVGDARDRFVEIIANLMKKSYLLFNQDNVSDEQIRADLSHVSGGKLELRAEVRLRPSSELLAGMNQNVRSGMILSAAKKKKKKKKKVNGGFNPMQNR